MLWGGFSPCPAPPACASARLLQNSAKGTAVSPEPPGAVAVHQQVLELPGSSLEAGRDLEMAENGDRRTGLEVLGSRRVWGSPEVPAETGVPGAGAGAPGRRGTGTAEPAPAASPRSHARQDGASWEPLGEAKAPRAERGQGALWRCPAAEKPIRNRGSEPGAGSPAGCPGVSAPGRKPAELAGDLWSPRSPTRAPGSVPTSQATPLRPQSANELRARSAGEGRILDAAAELCALSPRSGR